MIYIKNRQVDSCACRYRLGGVHQQTIEYLFQLVRVRQDIGRDRNAGVSNRPTLHLGHPFDGLKGLGDEGTKIEASPIRSR